MVTATARTRDGAAARAREIGPIGTISRLGVGLVAIGVPVALEGLSWWDAIGWIALAALATALARPMLLAFDRRAPAELRACSTATCALAAVLLGAAAGMGVATPAQGDVVFWGFLGISMLLQAARGDAGCELLAVSNTLLRRRDRIGCIIFTPIDAAEARRTASASGSTLTDRGGGRRAP